MVSSGTRSKSICCQLQVPVPTRTHMQMLTHTQCPHGMQILLPAWPGTCSFTQQPLKPCHSQEKQQLDAHTHRDASHKRNPPTSHTKRMAGTLVPHAMAKVCRTPQHTAQSRHASTTPAVRAHTAQTNTVVQAKTNGVHATNEAHRSMQLYM